MSKMCSPQHNGSFTMLENISRIELVNPPFVPGQNDLYNTNSQKTQLCRTKYGGLSEKKLMLATTNLSDSQEFG